MTQLEVHVGPDRREIVSRAVRSAVLSADRHGGATLLTRGDRHRPDGVRAALPGADPSGDPIGPGVVWTDVARWPEGAGTALLEAATVGLGADGPAVRAAMSPRLLDAVPLLEAVDAAAEGAVVLALTEDDLLMWLEAVSVGPGIVRQLRGVLARSADLGDPVAVAADLDALEATLRRGNAVVDSVRVALPSNGAGLTAALGVHGLRPDVVPPAAPRRADGLAHRGVTASARREPAARVEPTVERVGTGYRFVLDLPEVTADEVELSRHDDALQLSAHGTMRVVPLPPGLRRCAVERAGLAGGRLTLDLVPDPARWPR